MRPTPTPELVKTLCQHGHRTVGTPEHDAARDLLLREFAARNYAPYGGVDWALPYRMGNQDFVNLIAEVPGEDPALPPILIAAHYDTVPGTPGATDNAASIAVALDVADRVRKRPLRRSLVLGIFDAEEPPYFHGPDMGSIYFVANQMDDRAIATMIALDLIGTDPELDGHLGELAQVLPASLRGVADNRRVAGALNGALAKKIGVLGAEDDERWHAPISKAGKATERYAPLNLPHRIAPDMSDHYAFRASGYPYLFLSSGMTRHYHQASDTPDTLNWERIDDTTRFVDALVREADEAFHA